MAHTLYKALKSLPTLHSGHCDNLKIETDKQRVWVCRGSNAIKVERLKRGVWIEVRNTHDSQ